LLKVMIVFHRKKGMTHEEFVKEWLEKQIPLVAKGEGLVRYVANVATSRRGEEPPFDGIAELYFKDRETFEKRLKTPESDAVRAHIYSIIDHKDPIVVPRRYVVEPEISNEIRIEE